VNLRKTLLGMIIASSFGAVAIPAQAEIIVSVAPPAPRVERVPTYERRGYVWEQGYWRWNGRRHVWVAGHWERSRRGHVYVAPRWEERDGRWVYHSRRWDRDGDGVPNRYDSRPNNPNRS
jgi:hypothetical protein